MKGLELRCQEKMGSELRPQQYFSFRQGQGESLRGIHGLGASRSRIHNGALLMQQCLDLMQGLFGLLLPLKTSQFDGFFFIKDELESMGGRAIGPVMGDD